MDNGWGVSEPTWSLESRWEDAVVFVAVDWLAARSCARTLMHELFLHFLRSVGGCGTTLLYWYVSHRRALLYSIKDSLAVCCD
jgi:hypothetical protein